MSSNDLSSRFTQAAELLAVKTDSLIDTFSKNGISNDSTGILVLESKTTTIDDLREIIDSLVGNSVPKLKQKAAASIFKEAVSKKEVPAKNLSIVEELKMARPIEQWADNDLLNRYADKREYEVEQELHKRAKQQRFIVLVSSEKGYLPGKEVIDIEKSIELLKNARKRTNPSVIPVFGGVRPVYYITELNIQDRLTEICPICEKALYQGYCESCQVNFTDIGDDARAYVNLVSRMDNFNSKSMSDREALIVNAKKGLEILKKVWPSLSQTFDELKATGNLPILRIVASRPAKKVDDPFFQDGHRSVGNKKF